MTTKQEIREWLQAAALEGGTHVVIVCDQFDHEDFPVTVKPSQNAKAVAESYDKQSMHKVMEVYDLSKDLDAQLAEQRAFNY
jgi:hypothetical protein